MTSQVSWDHHTVPRLYLRGFCATKGAAKGKVLARRRADGADVLMTTKEATVIPGFYGVGEPGQPDDALEQWSYRNVENPVGELMATLLNGWCRVRAGSGTRTRPSSRCRWCEQFTSGT
jgi:hypothetical protein